MAVINILDKHTAELIAAGEVVERPASVVKELVENSIDAGANKIIIDIERGGIKKILIQDNGSGIDSEYVRTAFIRHATSKISSAKDLESIQSLGFRGEALASIASVSKIELITKTDIQDFAVELRLKGGEEESFEIKPFVTGTRFIVKDLFYNTPARMKFLKKDSTEASYIQDIITNLAISKPHISFVFKKDGKDVFSTIGDGNLLNTIACLYGTEFASQLTNIDYQDKKYKVEGYVTLPHFSKQSRNLQFMFINGRLVKNKTILAAVENAYKGSVMVGKFPGYIINFQMPYENIDVNVHPAKTEVRFDNESEIFGVIYHCVKNALEHNNTLKRFEFKDKQPIFIDNEPVKQQSFTEILDCKTLNDKEQPKITTEKSYNKFSLTNFEAESYNEILEISSKDENVVSFKEETNNTILNSEPSVQYLSKGNDFNINLTDKKYEYSYSESNAEKTTELEIESVDNFQDLNLVVLGEVFDTYIIFKSQEELFLMDKHAAHERLLYENYKKSIVSGKQLLLVPLPVKVSAKEKEALMANLDLLNQQGFEIEDFGLGGVALRAIPMNVSSEDPVSLILEIAHNLSNSKMDLNQKLDWIFHSVSCRSAIKAGDKTSIARLSNLIKDIQLQKIPLYCPHGRPVLIKITKKELEKQFGR